MVVDFINFRTKLQFFLHICKFLFIFAADFVESIIIKHKITMYPFNAQDLEQLQARGISLEKAEAQLECFRNGFPELDIVAPASTKKGILAPKRAE